MAAHKVLLSGDGYTADQLSDLAAAGLEPVPVGDSLPDDPGEVRAYLLGGEERLDSAALQRMPSIEAISFVGTGIGQFVDCPAAEARGIALLNTPGLMTDAVAEHTLGLLVALQRGLFGHNDAVKRHGIRPGPTRTLAESTIGIVGMGAIGQEVARQLRAGSGSALLYWSRARKPDVEKTLGIDHVTLVEMFGRADSVLVLLASTPETRGIVAGPLFDAIRTPIHLVNTAAAELVDPAALRRALDGGQVAAAAFDGYWNEPLPSPAEDRFGFLRYPDSRFVVTPHIAARTTTAWPRMIDAAVDNLLRHFGGSRAARA